MSKLSQTSKSTSQKQADSGSRQKVAARALEARRNVEDKLEQMRLRKASEEFDFDLH